MSEFLSKEEIKQWRSSLEKITLEEYAARLGKKIAEDKPTHDLADSVLHGQPISYKSEEWLQPKTERITTNAQRAFDREQEINPSPFSISKLKLSIKDEVSGKSEKTASQKVSKTDKKPVASNKVKTEKISASKVSKSVKAQKALDSVLSAKSMRCFQR